MRGVPHGQGNSPRVSLEGSTRLPGRGVLPPRAPAGRGGQLGRWPMARYDEPNFSYPTPAGPVDGRLLAGPGTVGAQLGEAGPVIGEALISFGESGQLPP